MMVGRPDGKQTGAGCCLAPRRRRPDDDDDDDEAVRPALFLTSVCAAPATSDPAGRLGGGAAAWDRW